VAGLVVRRAGDQVSARPRRPRRPSRSQVDEALSRLESILGQIGDELDCG